MKTNMPKAKKRNDWMNYIEQEDRERVRGYRVYTINSRFDVTVDAKNRVTILLHQNDDFQADTLLSKQALKKLRFVLNHEVK